MPRESGWRTIYARLNRSEEHTSELQSLTNLVCRLLLEKICGPRLRPAQARTQPQSQQALGGRCGLHGWQPAGGHGVVFFGRTAPPGDLTLPPPPRFIL